MTTPGRVTARIRKRKLPDPMAQLYAMGWYRKYKFIKPQQPLDQIKEGFQGYVSKDRKYIYQTKEACIAHIKHGSAKAEEVDNIKKTK